MKGFSDTMIRPSLFGVLILDFSKLEIAESQETASDYLFAERGQRITLKNWRKMGEKSWNRFDSASHCLINDSSHLETSERSSHWHFCAVGHPNFMITLAWLAFC